MNKIRIQVVLNYRRLILGTYTPKVKHQRRLTEMESRLGLPSQGRAPGLKKPELSVSRVL